MQTVSNSSQTFIIEQNTGTNQNIAGNMQSVFLDTSASSVEAKNPTNKAQFTAQPSTSNKMYQSAPHPHILSYEQNLTNKNVHSKITPCI